MICPYHTEQNELEFRVTEYGKRFFCEACKAVGDVLRNHDGTLRFVRDDEPMFPPLSS